MIVFLYKWLKKAVFCSEVESDEEMEVRCGKRFVLDTNLNAVF